MLPITCEDRLGSYHYVKEGKGSDKQGDGGLTGSMSGKSEEFLICLKNDAG